MTYNKGMLGTNQQKDPNQMSAGDKHTLVMQQLDEIKRYVAGIYAKVDTEIDDIRKIVDRIDNQVRESDRQIDKIEQFDRNLRTIENSVKEIERKVR